MPGLNLSRVPRERDGIRVRVACPPYRFRMRYSVASDRQRFLASRSMRRGRHTSYPGEWIPHRQRHAVDVEAPACTVCGIPTDDLVRFPELDFEMMSAAESCAECRRRIIQ